MAQPAKIFHSAREKEAIVDKLQAVREIFDAFLKPGAQTPVGSLTGYGALMMRHQPLDTITNEMKAALSREIGQITEFSARVNTLSDALFEQKNGIGQRHWFLELEFPSPELDSLLSQQTFVSSVNNATSEIGKCQNYIDVQSEVLNRTNEPGLVISIASLTNLCDITGYSSLVSLIIGAKGKIEGVHKELAP